MRSDGFRRDLTLAPGAGFRLRRRLSARIFSALLALAAIGWGLFDLWIGNRFVGAATIALAVAFVVQLVQAELDSWRFEAGKVVRRTFALRELRFRELRLEAREISGVQVAFGKGLARAWIETRAGEEVPLVEGDEREVRQIAERLAGTLKEPPAVLH
jgi:hypothetical protein